VLWASGPFPFDAFGWAELVTSQDTKTQPIDHLTAQLTAWHCFFFLKMILLSSSPAVRLSHPRMPQGRGGPRTRGGFFAHGILIADAYRSNSYSGCLEPSLCIGAQAFAVDGRSDGFALSPWLMRFGSSYFITYEGSRRGRLSVVHALIQHVSY